MKTRKYEQKVNNPKTPPKVNYLEDYSELKRKAKAFDEVKKYALSKYDEFEERKEFAENIDEWDYFNALNIANNAIINKCKQMEDE